MMTRLRLLRLASERNYVYVNIDGSGGVIAFNEPGMMTAQPVWFSVLADGYRLSPATSNAGFYHEVSNCLF